MTCILTQDRQHIITADTVERIDVNAGVIRAYTLGGAFVTIGTYKDQESVTKVMNYIAFSLASSTDSNGRAIVMPSQEVVSNDKEIAEKFLKSIRDKKADESITRVEISPELKEFLDGLKGGDSK